MTTSLRVQHLIIGLIVGLSAMPCAAAQEVKLLAGNQIPPYVFPETNSGAEIEIITAAFKTQNIDAKFTYVPLIRVSKDVDALQADGSTRMTDNSTITGFFSDPYITYQSCVVTLKDRPDFNKIENLNNKSIIAFQGASERFGADFKNMTLQNSRYTEKNDQHSQALLLATGRVDAIVADFLIASYYIHNNLKEEKLDNTQIKCNILLPNKPYQAFFKDKKIAELFNKGLQTIKANGTYQQLLEKYHVTGTNSVTVKAVP